MLLTETKGTYWRWGPHPDFVVISVVIAALGNYIAAVALDVKIVRVGRDNGISTLKYQSESRMIYTRTDVQKLMVAVRVACRKNAERVGRHTELGKQFLSTARTVSTIDLSAIPE